MPKYPLAMTTDGKKAKGKMKKMKPEAFLEAARKLTVGKGDRDIINKFKDDIKSGEPMGPLKLYKDGTEDGRHRATAAKELDLDSVPVIDERTAKALGGALASEDPNKFFSDVMKFSFAVLPLLRTEYLKSVPKQGFAHGGHVLEDDYPTHYLPEVGRQVMADGGVPGQRFAPIDPSMLVGTSPQPYRGGAAYTDPGGLKVAAPFVSGLAGGYPVFNLPAPSEPEKEEAPARPAPSGPDPMVLLALMKAAKMFADGGAIEGDVSFAPPEVEQALKTAQEVASPFTEAAPEKAGEFGILPLRTEGEKVVFDPSAGSVTEFVKHALTPKISPVEIAKGAYEMGKGALEDISSAADYFKQTMTGQKPMEPTSEEAIKSALNIAGALTTGSFGATKPAGALAMGAARPAETEAYKRLVNPAGMYSRAHEVAMTELPETARTWQEMHSLLTKAPGVKKEELYWAGLHPETFPAGEKVSREQIANLIEKNFPQVEPQIRGMDPELRRLEQAHKESQLRYNQIDNAYEEARKKASHNLSPDEQQEMLGLYNASANQSPSDFTKVADHYAELMESDPNNAQHVPDDILTYLTHYNFGQSGTGSHPLTAVAESELARRGRPFDPEASENLVDQIESGEHFQDSAFTPEAARRLKELQAKAGSGKPLSSNLAIFHGNDPQGAWASIDSLHPDLQTHAYDLLNQIEEHQKIAANLNQVKDAQRNVPRPRYEQHTIPGGTDYEERILQHQYNPVRTDYIHPEVQQKYEQQYRDTLAAQEAALARYKVAEEAHDAETVQPWLKDLREKWVQKSMSEGNLSSVEDVAAALQRKREANDRVNKAVSRYREAIRENDTGNISALSREIDEARRVHSQAADEYQQIYENSEAGIRDVADDLSKDRLLREMEAYPEYNEIRAPSQRMQEAEAEYEQLNQQKKEWRNKILEESKSFIKESPAYTRERYSHGHWENTDNPVVHTRNSTRTGPEGEKIWHQEELQSDWAQQGREKGFKDIKAEKALEEHGQQRQQLLKERDQLIENNLKTYRDALEPLRKEVDENISKAWEDSFAKEKEIGGDIPANSDKIQAIRQEAINKISQYKSAYEKAEGEITNNYWKTDEDLKNSFERKLAEHDANEPKVISGPIPSAPYTRDTEHWLELAAKDTLAQAIERGYDKIFITGGQEQAKRWSNELRKAVDNVRWETTTGTKPIDYENLPRLRDQAAREEHGRAWEELPSHLKDAVDRKVTKNYAPEGDSKTVFAKPVGSNTEQRFTVKTIVDPKGKTIQQVVDSTIPQAEGETLSSVIGGDLAKRVMSEESGNVPMKGYVMGSEGYTQTYERKAPSVYKKLIKALDPEAKVEAGALPKESFSPLELRRIQEDMVPEVNSGNVPSEWLDQLDEIVSTMKATNRNFDEAAKLVGADGALVRKIKSEASQSGPAGTYIDITPKMREEYTRLKKKHGAVFPAYKRGGGLPPFKKGGKIDSALSLVRKLAGTPA